MGVGMVTVVMVGAESSSDFSSSIFGTAGTSDERSFRIFLQGRPKTTDSQQPDLRRLINTSCEEAQLNPDLYEGLLDRISLLFWQSVTLSTDS